MIETKNLPGSVAARIAAMHQSMVGCVLYMQSHQGIFKRGMAGASVQCMLALEASGAVIMHRQPRAEAHYELAARGGQAVKRIDAYCIKRAEEMARSYRRRLALSKEWQSRARKPASDYRADPRGRVISLTDRKHWQHGNLAQPRTASSLGGNFFAYYG